MSSFNALVQERAENTPASFAAHGSPTSLGNPLARKDPLPAAPAAPAKTQAPAPARPPAPTGRPPASKAAARPQSKAQSERWAATQALKEKVDPIQLHLVMSILGAQGNQDNDAHKWKIPGIGNVAVNGQKWYNLESEEGGVNAVNLVMHAKSLNFPLAVKWLGDMFGESVDSDEIKAAAENSASNNTKKFFTPPPKSDRNIAKVKHYLKFTRRIPEELIDMLVSQGRIYASDDKDATCVFISEGIAELRSCFDGPDAVKKLVPGSKRNTGFMVLPDAQLNERVLAITESSIDAMSYRALNPGRAAVSSAGANQVFPRAISEDAVDKGFKVVAAFDADKAGDKASQALFNHFYLKLWLKHKAKKELNHDFDDDELFDLLNNKIIASNLTTAKPAGAPDSDPSDDFEQDPETALSSEEEGRNLFFFNKNDPFDPLLGVPTILVTIRKNDFGIPPCVKYPLEVSKRAYDFIIENVGISRDRPKGEKDWNEILKKRATPSIEATPSPIR